MARTCDTPAAIESRLTLRTATMLGIYTAVVAGLLKFLP